MAAGWDQAVVLDDRGVLLGWLGREALESDPASVVATVIPEGPVTFRSNMLVGQTATWMDAKGADSVLVTASKAPFWECCGARTSVCPRWRRRRLVLEEAMFHRILVAWGDGSNGDPLGDAATNLASRGDAEVLFVHVGDIGGCCAAVDHPALHEHEQGHLQAQVEKMASRGIRARSEQRLTASGRVAEHLLDVAVESRADPLIIAGAHPGRLRGRSQRCVLEKLLREAPYPVLVLSQAAPEPARAERPWSTRQGAG